MAAPASTEEFLDLVRKSGVTDERRFMDYVSRSRAANALAPDASRMAGLLVRDGILTQFQAEQILLGKWRRFTIGKYKVLERLGAGGMGSVYLCEHKLMRRRVAVKVLPTAKAQDESALERFYREARAVAALDHPNIVHAYDIDQDDQLHFLVMEYVDGVNLQDMVKKSGPIDILRACHYIRQSALGLEHANISGLVHRDIKPGNILVDRTGGVKILDMGLARFFNDEDDVLTKKFDENVLGTADYLAPEQAIDSHSVDIRADIYSLGATFYYLLTGRTPFGEGTVAQKLLWHQTRQPKLVSEHRKDCPPELVAIIAKMMDKEPDKRFQTPGELADALAPFTAIPIPPPPDSEMPTLSPAAQGLPPADPAADTEISLKSENAAPPVPKALQSMGYATVAKLLPESGVAKSPPASSPDTAAVSASTIHTPPVSPSPKPRSATRNGEQAEFTLTDANPSPKPKPNLPSPRKPASGVKQPVAANDVWSSVTAKLPPPPFEDEATDIEPARPPSSKRGAKSGPVAVPKKTSAVSLKLWLILGGVGFLFVMLIIVAIAIALSRPGPANPVAPVPGGRKPFEIGRGGEFPTLQSLVESRKLKDGDVVLITDENHVEQANIDGQKLPGAITVKPAPDRQVTWTLPAVVNDFPLLILKNAANLRFENLTFDAAFAKEAVEIVGSSPGLTFDKVVFKQYNTVGVKLIAAEGTKDNPIRFKDCTFEAPVGKDGFAFGFRPDVNRGKTDNLQLDNPTFNTKNRFGYYDAVRHRYTTDNRLRDAAVSANVPR